MQLGIDDLVMPILHISIPSYCEGKLGLTSKVISLDVLLDDSIIALYSRGCTAFNEEELFSCIALLDDVFSFNKCPGFEDIGNFGSLLRLKRGQDGDL